MHASRRAIHHSPAARAAALGSRRTSSAAAWPARPRRRGRCPLTISFAGARRAPSGAGRATRGRGATTPRRGGTGRPRPRTSCRGCGFSTLHIIAAAITQPLKKSRQWTATAVLFHRGPLNMSRGASGSTAAGAGIAAAPAVAAAAAAGSSDPCRDPSGVWSGLIRVLFPFGADAARAIWMDSAAVSPSSGLVRD